MEKDHEKKNYPAGAFDPLGYSKGPKAFAAKKIKQIINGIEESSQSVGSDSHSHRLESRTSSLQLSLAALICTIWRLRSGIATIIAERGDTTTWRLPLGC
ncbi:Chlorophyll A-B binding protein [Artemisia annua]|uniref:Chlorophyll A-B binding protein n=1 Tax=Artemisia annua TaxID=35608 RepID=A0A2U1PMN0_ARTAN|nr:Chlorophyll A-B binding protein [Artemisia annua]